MDCCRPSPDRTDSTDPTDKIRRFALVSGQEPETSEAPSEVEAAAGGVRLYCLGLSHHTASLEVRERFALGFEDASTVLAELKAQRGVLEAVWLVTCNRVELYAVIPVACGDRSRPGAGAVKPVFTRQDNGRFTLTLSAGCDRLLRHFYGRPGLNDSEVTRALYGAESAGVVEHLFRVASGLDSMVLGETEILGQLKEAYELARREGHTGRVLNAVFQGAFRAAKRVRSETGIQRGSVSVASLAAELAQETCGDLTGCRVLVIGAGDTGEKVTRALLDRGVAEVRIVNRSEERGRALAATLGPRAQAIPDGLGALDEVDVVVGSTSSPEYVLDAARLEPVLRGRKGRPLVLLDLAVPRDFDPAIAQMPGVALHNLDDLRALADRHLDRRRVEVERCEDLLRGQVRDVVDRIESQAAMRAGSSLDSDE